MSASRFADLPESPFARLASLIEGLTPGKPPIALSLGEPRHPFPAFIMEAIAANAADFGRYPPIIGTPAFRAAATGWLNRRFGLPEGWLDPENQLLPVNGTREALFNMAIVATPLAKAGKKPAILMPNPFYQCYAAAALAAGAEPVYVAATKENGFLPDFAALPEELLARTSMIYFCSPANPQGSVADLGYLKELILLARRHGILLAMDECYADIYDRAAPPGALKAAFELDGTADDVIVLHSLSKRSSLPGLRSGFCAGDRAFIAKFRSMRNIAAPQVPLPLLAASTLAWADDAHAADNRTLYQRKIDMAERILGNRFGFYRPAGGFFLWLDVEDGEAATRRLWTEAGVKVLPGAYLARDDESVAGGNPGRAFIRVALVEAENVMEEALKRMAEAL